MVACLPYYGMWIGNYRDFEGVRFDWNVLVPGIIMVFQRMEPERSKHQSSTEDPSIELPFRLARAEYVAVVNLA